MPRFRPALPPRRVPWRKAVRVLPRAFRKASPSVAIAPARCAAGAGSRHLAPGRREGGTASAGGGAWARAGEAPPEAALAAQGSWAWARLVAGRGVVRQLRTERLPGERGGGTAPRAGVLRGGSPAPPCSGGGGGRLGRGVARRHGGRGRACGVRGWERSLQEWSLPPKCAGF